MTKILKYFQPSAGNTEHHIDVKPVKILHGLQSAYLALKEYEILPFGKGLPATLYILKHILRNKLATSPVIQRSFWQNIVVAKVKCQLRDKTSGKSPSQLNIKSIKQLNKKFAQSEGARVQVIEKYAHEMANGKQFNNPIYATGTVLNQIGANANPYAIYMIDGARRITATVLNGQDDIVVYLLMTCEQFADLIDANIRFEIVNQIQKISWFPRYQTIPLLGIHGQRSLHRFSLIDMHCFEDKTVADFGCSLGQSCIEAAKAGAAQVVGIEGQSDTFSVANQINKAIGFPTIEYIKINFNANDFDSQIDGLYPNQFDYCFFTSVYRTKELVDRDRLFQYIIDKTKLAIFFEGHADPKIDTIEYYENLFDVFNLNYHYLGLSEQRLRPLFKVSKK